MKFKVGDVAVYPGKGVGRIEKINKRLIPGLEQEIELYVVIFPSNAETEADITSSLEVPVQLPAGKGRLRRVMPLDQVQELQDILRVRDIEPSNQTWNRRYREYMAKIATGEPEQIAEVLRDLALLRLKKNLSFGERKMYDQAMDLLIEEWAHTLKTYQKDSKKLSMSQLHEEIASIIEGIFLPDQEAAALAQEEKAKAKKNKKNKKKAEKNSASAAESQASSTEIDPSDDGAIQTDSAALAEDVAAPATDT